MRQPITFALLVALAACSETPRHPGAADKSPSAATDVAAQAPAPPGLEPAFETDCAFCANPPTVRTCDVASGVATVLYWNVVASGVPRVGIYVVDEAGQDAAFAEQPPSGSIQTGPWLRPGLTFKLKDPEGNVLHTVTVDAEDC